MPGFAAEAVDRLDPARLDRGDQRGVRVEHPVPGDPALQAELLAVGRQQQFDRGGVEPDTVIQRHHLMAFVDAADRDHRLEDLDVADVPRVAGEQRLQEERPVGLRPRSPPSRRECPLGEAHAVSTISSACTITTPSWNAAASAIVGVSSVLGPVYRLPSRVGRRRAEQHDIRGQVDEHPRVQLDVGVDGADVHRAVLDHLRDPHALRARVGQVEFRRRCRARTGRDARAGTPTRSACAGR